MVEKSNHGRELIIMDLDNNINVSLPIQVFQDPSRALMTQPCPSMNTVELLAIGDFIRAHESNSRGKI